MPITYPKSKVWFIEFHSSIPNFFMFEEFTSAFYYLSRVLSNMSFDSTATSGLFKPFRVQKNLLVRLNLLKSIVLHYKILKVLKNGISSLMAKIRQCKLNRWMDSLTWQK